MFNFLKKKGKEKSNFFDNKVVSTPKSSKIFRKFVQSEMGQNSSLEKSANKKPLKKSDSKDEEYNTAPNSPEVEKNDFIADSFLAIDEDSDLDISDSLLQNNNRPQSKPDSPSTSTSNDSKAPQSPKPSVLLKSTPDAFYTKKINNVNKRDLLKSQITNGSQNGSGSSKSNSFEESELNNNHKNITTNTRRNSDTNHQVVSNSPDHGKKSTRLSKQNSADSIQYNIEKNESEINSHVLNNSIGHDNTKSVSESLKRNFLNDSLTPNIDRQTGLNGYIVNNNNTCNNNLNNVNSCVTFEGQCKNLPSESNNRRESDVSVSESASIVIKAHRNVPGFNKFVDADDSDVSLDSCSITASFEIKEAPNREEINRENVTEQENETVTYLTGPESITLESEQHRSSPDTELKENNNHLDSETNETRVIEKSTIGTENRELFQNKLNSIESKTDTFNFNFLKQDQAETQPLKSNSVCNGVNDLPELDHCAKEEISNKPTLSSSMCITENSGKSQGISQPDREEESFKNLDSELTKVTHNNIDSTDVFSPQKQEVDSKINLLEFDSVKKERLENDSVEEVNQQLELNSKIEEESDIEEEESEDDKEEEEEKEEIQNPQENLNSTNETQMETDLVTVGPKPKVKKFVRFALIHNTYHGSDTSESEEEDDDEEEEEEESEDEDDEEENGEQDVKDEAIPSKMEEDKPINNEDMDHHIDSVQAITVDQETPVSNADNSLPLIPQVYSETREDPFIHEKEEYETRVRDLQAERSEFEDRLHNLTSDLELKQLEMNQLKGKIGELENQVLTKTWAMDRKEAELISAGKEAEHVRQKLRRLEDDLTEYRLKNSDLTEELVRKIAEENKRKEETCDFFKIRELEEKLSDAGEKIKALEEQLGGVRRGQEEAAANEKIMRAETEVEMKIMREALDEALKQKSVLQKRFESEFNQLRSSTTAQEQQLLDDFEWKLREVEQGCKKKVLEAEKCKRDLEARVTRLTAEVEELSKYKNVEAELAQLRSVSHEHQRSIRTITRQKEELQVNEKILNEEVSRLRAALEKEKNHITTLQAIHSREITEKNRKHQFKLDQQKNELQEQFEERLKKEALRVKVESEKHHLEDKRVAVEHTRTQADTKLQEQKKKWEKQLQEAQRQVESLKERLREGERVHRQELDSAQTHSDQSMLELRRKFDKLDMGYQEQIEKAQEKHEQEIEHLTEEYERRLGQCEASWQQQLSTTRTTLELVKEQMRRDSYDQIQLLKTQHQRELEEQWARLIQERDEALAELEQRHRSTIEQLRTEIEIRSKKSHSEAELRERVQQLEQDLQTRNILIASLQSSLQAGPANSATQQQPSLGSVMVPDPPELIDQSLVLTTTPSQIPGLKFNCLIGSRIFQLSDFEDDTHLLSTVQSIEDERSLVPINAAPVEDLPLIVSTDDTHPTSPDYQHSFTLVFLIFVILSHLLRAFIWPFLLSTLMFFFCVL